MLWYPLLFALIQAMAVELKKSGWNHTIANSQKNVNYLFTKLEDPKVRIVIHHIPEKWLLVAAVPAEEFKILAEDGIHDLAQILRMDLTQGKGRKFRIQYGADIIAVVKIQPPATPIRFTSPVCGGPKCSLEYSLTPTSLMVKNDKHEKLAHLQLEGDTIKTELTPEKAFLCKLDKAHGWLCDDLKEGTLMAAEIKAVRVVPILEIKRYDPLVIANHFDKNDRKLEFLEAEILQ